MKNSYGILPDLTAVFKRRIYQASCLFFAVTALLCLAACQTDYRTEAAEDARRYALRHTKELSETDRNFIRYTDPAIYSNLLFPSRVPVFSGIGGGPNRFDAYKAAANPNLDYMHTAFVWELPKAGFSVVVDGTGERNQRGWSPDIVVYKKFIPENTAFTAAHIKAIEFLVNFFPDLKLADINRVRFYEPRVVPTRFPITRPEELSRDSQIKKWMEYIRSGKGLEKQPAQISLVWKSPLNGEEMVVCGTSPSSNLNGWAPKKAFLLSPDELEKMIVREKQISLQDPTNDKGERIETPETLERKVIETKPPDRPVIRR